MHDPEAFANAKARVRPITAGLINEMLESLTWPSLSSSSPKSNLRILDYGCGPGMATLAYIVPYAEKLDGHIVGVDASPEMVQHAKEKSAHPRVEYHEANLFKSGASATLPEFLAPGSYDIVICNQVLHFLKPHKLALARLGTLLKPGGQLGFVNMTESPHFRLMEELAAEPRFMSYMEAHAYKNYIPEWVETAVDFEQDLRVDGALPSWLRIAKLQTKRLKDVDIELDIAVQLMYSLGPLAGTGRVPKDVEMEMEVKDWYRQRITEKFEIGDGDKVRGSGGETVIGVLQRAAETEAEAEN